MTAILTIFGTTAVAGLLLLLHPVAGACWILFFLLLQLEQITLLLKQLLNKP